MMFSCKGDMFMQNIEYMVNRHSCYYLKFHLVVVTKFRKPLFENENLKQRLIEITTKIIESDWNCNIDNINTDSDHVHIMFRPHPKSELSKFSNAYKSVSSRLIK